MNNKSIGNYFEKMIITSLAEHRFWAYGTPNKAYGQPTDIIAAKDGTAYLIECKTCAGNVFDTKRIESNQKYAIKRWKECGNKQIYFAILINGEIYMIEYDYLFYLHEQSGGGRYISTNLIKENAFSFERWCLECS